MKSFIKSFKNNPLYRLCVAQLLETVREPGVLFWGMLFPVLISIGLGLAFTQKSELKFKVYMAGDSPALLDSLLDIYAEPSPLDGGKAYVWKVGDKTLGDTEFTFVAGDWRKAIVSLKRGESDLIVSDSLGKVVYHFDPHSSQAQLVYMKLSQLLAGPAGEGGAAVEALTLKGVRYIDFLVPGLITFGIMSSIMWGRLSEK
jgi:hypothetical protein